MAIETQLLSNPLDESIDYKGRPVYRFNSGGWKSALFIIGVEVAERSAYYGIAGNLITYLTGPLGQSTVTAAENMNVWSGTSWLLPLLGAFVADSFLGRYRTIVVSTLIYILGLGLLALSAVLPSVRSSDYPRVQTLKLFSPDTVLILIFFALYVVALGQGGFRPCVQAFGADQFEGQDPEESEAKSSFFNWWNFFMNAALIVILLALNYIQDNLNWGLGFGIPCIIMAGALIIFLLGTKTYRYRIIRSQEKHAFLRIGRVFIAAITNWRITHAMAIEEEALIALPHRSSEKFNFKIAMLDLPMARFLNKALLEPKDSQEDREVCSLKEVEEAKALLRLLPIWTTSLIYAVVLAQPTTFFTKQARTMNRLISADLEVPAASLQLFIPAAVVVLVPIYDRVLVPKVRVLTGEPSGITMLQRIGTGIFLSVLAMVVAALVEMKRLKTAEEYGLVDTPNVTIPMSCWWLIPQNLLLGAADVFTVIGLQELFCDQFPNELRSVGVALYLSITGVGSFLSSFLISAIEKATCKDGQDSWFANNLNRAHLDYFYWLLAVLSSIELVAFLYFAKSHIYKRGGTT